MAVNSLTMQFSTPSTQWNVAHNLGKFVTSDVFFYDAQSRPVKVIPLEVIYVDDNNITIKFSQPQSGFVKVYKSFSGITFECNSISFDKEQLIKQLKELIVYLEKQK